MVVGGEEPAAEQWGFKGKGAGERVLSRGLCGREGEIAPLFFLLHQDGTLRGSSKDSIPRRNSNKQTNKKIHSVKTHQKRKQRTRGNVL